MNAGAPTRGRVELESPCRPTLALTCRQRDLMIGDVGM